LFLLAVSAALGITLWAVAPSIKLIAGIVVVPIVAVTLALLYFERKGRRWSFAAAAALGVFGVVLRLAVSAKPSLEVDGGLPIWVTIAYVGLGAVVIFTSLWTYLAFPGSPRPG